MAQAEEPIDREDGRRLRGQKNRRRIVEAMLELVREGNISPSAEDVSAKADVGLRTVFRHFKDMDSLYREISELMFAEIEPTASDPLPEGDWPLRLEAIIDRRIHVFEKIMPFKIAADIHKHRSAFLREDDAALMRMQRSALREALPADLRNNRMYFETIDLLMSFDSWRRLRKDQRLSVAQARKMVHFAVDTIAAAAGLHPINSSI